MHGRAIVRLFGVLLLLYSISFVPSILISVLYDDGESATLAGSLFITAIAGTLCWLPNRHNRHELSMRDGFLIVTLFWILLSIVGALPFIIGLHLNITDAIFESVSGFTTTGATVIVGLDRLPPSILYHRQQIQWLGGMGVIVLAVAIFPFLGVGGMQLYRAETSGVTKHDKPTPRIAETARVLWFLYAVLTLVCALSFWLAGMSLFDAVAHAFTTVATGGFSTHDASLGYYNSPLIEGIAIVFMIIGGINFTIHFLAWRHHDWLLYLKDPEVRVYLLIFISSSVFVAISLLWMHVYHSGFETFRHATFQVASILTSTGFGTANFAEWPRHIPLTLAILSFTGGCAGSTAGGIKILRVLLLTKMGSRQLFQLAHPHAVARIKLGHRVVSEDVLFSVWGFYVLYMLTALLLTLFMMAAGLDLESAFGAVFATINLLGPGLGEVATNFTTVSSFVKWLAIFGMLVGRLEVFTLLILFLPAYWSH
jgi:trk system potassium uptake protein TrkH